MAKFQSTIYRFLIDEQGIEFLAKIGLKLRGKNAKVINKVISNYSTFYVGTGIIIYNTGTFVLLGVATSSCRRWIGEIIFQVHVKMDENANVENALQITSKSQEHSICIRTLTTTNNSRNVVVTTARRYRDNYSYQRCTIYC